MKELLYKFHRLGVHSSFGQARHYAVARLFCKYIKSATTFPRDNATLEIITIGMCKCFIGLCTPLAVLSISPILVSSHLMNDGLKDDPKTYTYLQKDGESE